jgi:hypothetical protein
VVWLDLIIIPRLGPFWEKLVPVSKLATGPSTNPQQRKSESRASQHR